jgi:predicted dinucleotide-binding enzyme
MARTRNAITCLIRDVSFNPVDPGLLSTARYVEPFAQLVAQIAYNNSNGSELAYRSQHFPNRAR